MAIYNAVSTLSEFLLNNLILVQRVNHLEQFGEYMNTLNEMLFLCYLFSFLLMHCFIKEILTENIKNNLNNTSLVARMVEKLATGSLLCHERIIIQ